MLKQAKTEAHPRLCFTKPCCIFNYNSH